MSYDLGLYTPTENREDEQEVFSVNYTYNVRPMFLEAFKDFGDNGLYVIDGLRAALALPILSTAIQKMKEPFTIPAYKALNPKNGWGDYKGALKFLTEFEKASDKNPDMIVRVY